MGSLASGLQPGAGRGGRPARDPALLARGRARGWWRVRAGAVAGSDLAAQPGCPSTKSTKSCASKPRPRVVGKGRPALGGRGRPIRRKPGQFFEWGQEGGLRVQGRWPASRLFLHASLGLASLRPARPAPSPPETHRQRRPSRLRPLRARPASAHFKVFSGRDTGSRYRQLSTSGCCASQGCAPGARVLGGGSASPGRGRLEVVGRPSSQARGPGGEGQVSPWEGLGGSFRASLGVDRAQAGRSSAAPPPGSLRQGEGTPTWHSGNRKCWPAHADGGCSWWLSGTLH